MTQMSGDMVSAIKLQSTKQWEDYFDSLVREAQDQISGCPDAELPSLKAKVLAIKEMKQTFLREYNR